MPILSSLTRQMCLLVGGSLLLPAATLPPGITVSNPQLAMGTAADFTLTTFNAASGLGIKISGTIDAVCGAICQIAITGILGTTNGASTIDAAWDFTVAGSPAAWTITNGGGTTYASGGPATGQFTGSTTVNTGQFLFRATGDNPFSIVIPNNSIDFTPTAPSAVPEPATGGLLAAAALAAVAAYRGNFRSALISRI